MHGLQIHYRDGTQKTHWFETLAEWEQKCTIAQLLGAQVRFWSETAQSWTRWF